jgi:hypothetical protein
MMPEQCLIVAETLVLQMEAYIMDKRYEISITRVLTFQRVEAERDAAMMYAHWATWGMIKMRRHQHFELQSDFLTGSDVLEMLRKPRIHRPTVLFV